MNESVVIFSMKHANYCDSRLKIHHISAVALNLKWKNNGQDNLLHYMSML